MNDSLEKLALSSTFIVRGSSIEQVSSEGGDAFAGAQQPTLPVDFIVDGKYRIIKLIGRGGMGAVYKVRHELLQKEMALKTISTHAVSGESWQRFQREAQAIAKLRHKNIVEVFDYGIAGGELPYYTMEILYGENLFDRLTRLGPMETDAALKLFIQVAEGMAHAHHLQIVHRDIKPANVFVVGGAGVQGTAGGDVNSSSYVKVLDFGTAKLVTDSSPDSQYKTGIGAIFGSPLYMSPEQSRGDIADKRSDIYSFGCSLFQALTGSPPFVGANAFLTLMSHQQSPPPALRDINPACRTSQRLDNLMAKLLAKEPEKRFQSFEEIVDELNFCLAASRKAGLSAPGYSRDKVADYEEGPHEGTDDSGDIDVSNKGPSIVRMAMIVCVIAAIGIGLTLKVMTPSGPRPESGTESGTQTAAKNADYSDPSKWKEEDAIELTKVPQYRKNIARIAAGDDQKPIFVAGAGNASQQLQQSSLEVKPYLQEYQRTPAGCRVTFLFPVGDNHAELSITGQPPQKCSGRVSYFSPHPACLICYQGMTADFLHGFKDNDVLSLQLKDVDQGEWTDEHLDAISHMKGLRQLDISQTSLDERALPYIDRIDSLCRLSVSETLIKGQGLAKLKILPKLKRLEVSQIEGVSYLIRHLPDNSLLERFIAGRDSLGDGDMPYLARLAHLTSISLDNNKITAKGLQAFEKPNRIRDLSMLHNDIGPQCAGIIHNMTRLGQCRISHGKWSEAERKRLLDMAPPGCKLSDGTRLFSVLQ